jgi:SecD/SecF fusion protein
MEEANAQRLKREHPDWSNEAIEKNLDRKKYEYFILTRVSPEDSMRVGGDITLKASIDTQPDDLGPCIDFWLNEAGAERLRKITKRNKPLGGFRRQLAVIFDDRVVAAPSIVSQIADKGQITGKFDQKTVDRFVQILRSGALPVELRERPVNEYTVEPTTPRETPRKKSVAVGLAVGLALGTVLVTCIVSVLIWRWLSSRRPSAGAAGVGSVGVSG